MDERLVWIGWLLLPLSAVMAASPAGLPQKPAYRWQAARRGQDFCERQPLTRSGQEAANSPPRWAKIERPPEKPGQLGVWTGIYHDAPHRPRPRRTFWR
jgi:hypothetical protein